MAQDRGVSGCPWNLEYEEKGTVYQDIRKDLLDEKPLNVDWSSAVADTTTTTTTTSKKRLLPSTESSYKRSKPSKSVTASSVPPHNPGEHASEPIEAISPISNKSSSDRFHSYLVTDNFGHGIRTFTSVRQFLEALRDAIKCMYTHYPFRIS